MRAIRHSERAIVPPHSYVAVRHPATDLSRDPSVIQVASSSSARDVSAMSVPRETQDLRSIAAAFESAQAQRLKTGEQIRVLLGNRESGDPSLRSGHVGNRNSGTAHIEALLARIRAGGACGTAPGLADAYQRQWSEERDLLRLLTERIARHPTWPWLVRVRGLGPSLSARLLARLEIERAPTPSSFWSYCGLATVAAHLYHCAECGYELSLPAGRHLRSAHRVPGSAQPCDGTLAPIGEGTRRVAQPRPSRGEHAPYDREAKKLCYLIGTSFVRQGDAYRRYYNEQRARLDASKRDWIPRRRHLTALRMTEKLFLAHLWLVWREQLGLPVTAPYMDNRDDAAPAPRPWAMVDA